MTPARLCVWAAQEKSKSQIQHQTNANITKPAPVAKPAPLQHGIMCTTLNKPTIYLFFQFQSAVATHDGLPPKATHLRRTSSLARHRIVSGMSCAGLSRGRCICERKVGRGKSTKNDGKPAIYSLRWILTLTTRTCDCAALVDGQI